MPKQETIVAKGHYRVSKGHLDTVRIYKHESAFLNDLYKINIKYIYEKKFKKFKKNPTI